MDILDSFWHRGRKAFLPMTSADLGRKMGKSPLGASTTANAQVAKGFVQVTGGNGRSRDNPIIYELTEAGRNVVMARMTQEAM